MLIALAVLAVIAAIGIVVRALEPRLAFFPAAGESVTPADLGVPYTASVVASDDDVEVRVWSMRHARPRATILYFHGNGGNLSVWAPILAGVYRQGYTVFALDYRGYGLSTGRPTERGLYRDAAAVAAWAADHLEAEMPLVYWGRSLGGAMAAFAATVRRPDAVIVEAGFPDTRSLLKGSVLGLFTPFSSYRFPAAQFLRDAGAPTLIMHGDADGIVPFSAGRELFERIGEPKRFFAIAGGDHNDVVPPDAEGYWRAVDDFIAASRPARGGSR